eukprot:1066522-Pelagomonas_calceolata.AAC.1
MGDSPTAAAVQPSLHFFTTPAVTAGLGDSQVGRGSLDSQGQESPDSAARRGEENAGVGAAVGAEGGANVAGGGGRLWSRRGDLAQISVGGLPDKGRDASRPGGARTRRGGLSHKDSSSPRRSPREGPWGSEGLPSKRTVSFQ